MNQHKIVIAGGGFGGVRAALRLAKSKECHITLVSAEDTFRYYPALYATATGHSHQESIIPLASMLKEHTNITFVQDTVTKLDKTQKILHGSTGEIYRYDSLILALGVVTNYFNIQGLEEYSFGIKSQEEVDELKDHLHTSLTNEHKLDPNYVVIGAGPTGVELAASLRSYISHIAHYHNIAEHDAKVDLIEAMDHVLPKMSPRASSKVQKRLSEIGITLMLSSKVTGETVDSLTVEGQDIPTHTVIWTSGVANNPFYAANSDIFNLAQNGKVKTDEFLQGAPSVYVIGDNAATTYSGLAQTALYDADFVTRNIKRQTKHIRPKKYKPRKPPVVVPVGEDWAIFEWGPLVFGGRLGGFLRRAADFVAYSDLLPARTAWQLWRKADQLEEQCQICRKGADALL